MTPGIYKDMGRDEYTAVRRLNWSTLKHFAKSPAHYRAALEEPQEDKSTFRVGNATHVAVLEPARFEAEYVTYPGRRAGKAWDAFEREQTDAGRSILSTSEHDLACRLRDAVHRHPIAAGYLATGAAEVTALWNLAAGDYRFELKGRADWLSEDGVLLDLKTCIDASPEGFARAAARMAYPAQMSLYKDGLSQFVPIRKVVIVAVEKTSPYAVTVFNVPMDVLHLGRDHYLEMLGRLEHCRATDTWPGYAEAEVDLTLPAWTKTYEEETHP